MTNTNPTFKLTHLYQKKLNPMDGDFHQVLIFF